MSPWSRPEPPASSWFFCHPDRSDTAFSCVPQFGAPVRRPVCPFRHSYSCPKQNEVADLQIGHRPRRLLPLLLLGSPAMPEPPPSRPRPLTHHRSHPRAGRKQRPRASSACSFPAWDSSTIVIRAKRSSWLGDRFVADMRAYRSRPPQRGEIIMMKHASSDALFVKRVIGLPATRWLCDRE